MSAITVKDLSKRYGAFNAVEAISFEVRRGEVVALLGPNGAGKTTTIEILEGFLAPSGGAARVLGSDPRRAGRAWRARIGLVLQSTSLDAQLSVREALALHAGLFPRPRPLAEVLDLVDLDAEAETRIGVLSGGQRRRVDLALGVVGGPELLFLDEPTTGLDPEARRRIWLGIERLAAAGTTVVMTTHYLEEAQRLADRVIVLSSGRIIADATPDQLRAAGAGTLIRYRLPPEAPVGTLPAALARHFDAGRRQLLVRGVDLPTALEGLAAWARSSGLDLAGLEVGPPSLEDAYLALTSQRHTLEEVEQHG
jgi:ABC-2 type transport system ATP-binding protein